MMGSRSRKGTALKLPRAANAGVVYVLPTSNRTVYFEADVDTWEDTGGTDPTEDADNLLSWTNHKDGLSSDLWVRQAAAQEGVWNTGQINGHPAVTFTGSNFDNVSIATDYSPGSDSTILAVMSADTGIADGVCLFTLGSTSASGTSYSLRYAATGTKLQLNGLGTSSEMGAISLDTWFLLTVLINNTAGEVDWRINRVRDTLDGAPSIPAWSNSAASFLGKGASGAVTGWTGKLAGLAIYNAVLAGDDLVNAEGYFADKYGL